MINIGLQTEYSFKQTFGKLDDVIQYHNGTGILGIADVNNTFGHVKFEKLCKTNNIKPLFGVKLMAVENPEEKVRSRFGAWYTFIAKNQDGYRELNELVTTSFEKFYYKAMISLDDLIKISNNIIVICDAPEIIDRLDYIALTPKTLPMYLDIDLPKVAMNVNRYSHPQDKVIYQCLAGARKNGDGYSFKFNEQTYPQHILSEKEFLRIWKGQEDAVANTYKIAEQCDVQIPKAPMIHFKTNKTIEQLCTEGAKKKKINLNNETYKARLERELDMIHKKDYVDYFLIVADMVIKAKKKMMVGPARGSAAGSLVCYLLDITEVDPIPHKLIFERFIDITRDDLPDIDIDFPDEKRKGVINSLIKQFGKENVCHISNINRLKAKSAISEFAMSLSIPKWEADLVKDALVDRSGGDARAAMGAQDTLLTTEIGRDFMEKYPAMSNLFKAESHATHAGIHAAGIVVCNEPIAKFGAVNARDGSIMMDKKDAESKNLLKIDCLGLRTLSILEEAATLAGFHYSEYYKMDLKDEETFEIFNEMRLSGVFQFEGQAMQMLCKQMEINSFEDIVAITALARPGPLHSGGADTYVKRRMGREPVEYISDHKSYVDATKDTYGVVVYQEQLMNICKECGLMTWEDVSEIRKAASKTYGKEFFNKYKDKFLEGCIQNKIGEEKGNIIWENIMTFGSWAMNLSHSVSYGMISYWCAYMKKHHPLEFAAANLNNSKSDSSSIKLLRDITENDGIEYIAVDPDLSDVKWSIADGKLVGGLTNIHGIGDSKAKDIISKRNSGAALTPAIIKKLMDSETPFDTLYPCWDKFHDYYNNYEDYGLTNKPVFINDVSEVGEYVVIGQVITKDLRDLNEYNEVAKRGGKVLEDKNKFLKLVIEDDTGQIFTKINRFQFDNMEGSKINEEIVEGKSWVIIRGSIRDKAWRILNIEAIHILEK
jgi:DNA polymerase III alpha subunit